MSHRPAHRALATLALVSLPLLAGSCGSTTADAPASTAESPVETGTPKQPEEPGADGGDGGSEFTAGTYQASGGYVTPDGPMEVDVEVTLDEAGTIQDVTVTPLAHGGNSLLFQTRFAGGIADVVVGRPIDELEVSRVSGSSLTSGGFNSAIEQIIAEAGS